MVSSKCNSEQDASKSPAQGKEVVHNCLDDVCPAFNSISSVLINDLTGVCSPK